MWLHITHTRVDSHPPDNEAYQGLFVASVTFLSCVTNFLLKVDARGYSNLECKPFPLILWFEHQFEENHRTLWQYSYFCFHQLWLILFKRLSYFRCIQSRVRRWPTYVSVYSVQVVDKSDCPTPTPFPRWGQSQILRVWEAIHFSNTFRQTRVPVPLFRFKQLTYYFHLYFYYNY